MHLSKFVHTKTGKYFLSMILGLGLASLFRKLCKENDKSCIQYTSAPLKETEGKTHHFDNKCFTFTARATSCNNNNGKRIAHLSNAS